ncbi:MAG: EamA family transporter, partial [Butyrivibrio sp.]|uniref:EamA family transporter n=1 Tax=Butyrivibrio sp. TaxID=28121 RepID=UPI001B28AFCD
MDKNKLKGILLTTIGAACWGLSGSVGQYLFDVQMMDSRWLVPIRLGLSGVLILLYSLIKYPDSVFLPWKSKEKAITMLIYGLAGVSACQFLYFLTIELSTAAVGTIMQDLAPIFILGYTCITTKRLPKFLEILSIIMALLGVFFLTSHGNIATKTVPSLALIT